MDIVDDFLTRIRTVAADLPDDALRTVEGGLRKEWGGAEVYIRKHSGHARRGRRSLLQPDLTPVEREGILAAGLQQGRPLPELFREAGLCKSKGFKALAKSARGLPRAKRP